MKRLLLSILSIVSIVSTPAHAVTYPAATALLHTGTSTVAGLAITTGSTGVFLLSGSLPTLTGTSLVAGLTLTGSGDSLFLSGSLPVPTATSLVAGLTLSATGNAITLGGSLPTLTGSSSVPGLSLAVSGSVVAISGSIQSLSAASSAPGLSLSVSGTVLTLSGTSSIPLATGTVPGLEQLNGDASMVRYGDGSWAVPPGASGGEANTVSNLGAGSGLYASKSGIDLRFKSLVSGSNIVLASTGTDVTISASGGSGGSTYDFAADQATRLALTGRPVGALVLQNDVSHLFMLVMPDAISQVGGWIDLGAWTSPVAALLAEYKLASLADSSGNGHTLTQTGGTATFAAGKVGNAATFTHGLELTAPFHLDMTKDFYIAGWLKTTSDSAFMDEWGDYNLLGFVSGGNLCFAVSSSSTATATAVADGSWHFVEFRHTASIKEEACAVDHGTWHTGTYTATLSGTDPLKFGDQASGTFTGSLDAFVIYQGIPTDPARAALYNSGSGYEP